MEKVERWIIQRSNLFLYIERNHLGVNRIIGKLPSTELFDDSIEKMKQSKCLVATKFQVAWGKESTLIAWGHRATL